MTEIAKAVDVHAKENELDTAAVWKKVDRYIDEIVPFFNILAYYRFGYFVSRALLNMFYKVSAEQHGERGAATLPKDAIVVYLMNHRSNADYVLVGYVLTGEVAISYAVGEWARAFPLEYIFKSFGSYFIRRKFREPLYHTVLERYVQLITRNGVTQGIFPEGGLSRDGKLRSGEDRTARLHARRRARPGVSRPHLSRSGRRSTTTACSRTGRCCASWRSRKGSGLAPRRQQLGEVARYVWWNSARLRRAALEAIRPRGGDDRRAGCRSSRGSTRSDATGEPMFDLPRHERLGAGPGAVRRHDVANRRDHSGHAGVARLRGDPALDSDFISRERAARAHERHARRARAS